jgi:hypothetical protein
MAGEQRKVRLAGKRAARKAARKAGRKAERKAKRKARKQVAASKQARVAKKIAPADKELRKNLEAAFKAAKSAHKVVSKEKGPTDLAKNRKLQKNAKDAGQTLRDVCKTIGVKPGKSRRSKGIVKTLAVLGIGGGVALAKNEGLREKTLDTMFGKEQEFDYSSTTSP